MSEDLVEELIFNAYKDKNVMSAKVFKKMVYDNFKYRASTDLYARILNYQIKKYGNTLQDKGGTGFVKHFQLKCSTVRHYQRECLTTRIKLEKYIERVENEKIKRKANVERKKSKRNIN